MHAVMQSDACQHASRNTWSSTCDRHYMHCIALPLVIAMSMHLPSVHTQDVTPWRLKQEHSSTAQHSATPPPWQFKHQHHTSTQGNTSWHSEHRYHTTTKYRPQHAQPAARHDTPAKLGPAHLSLGAVSSTFQPSRAQLTARVSAVAGMKLSLGMLIPRELSVSCSPPAVPEQTLNEQTWGVCFLL